MKHRLYRLPAFRPTPIATLCGLALAVLSSSCGGGKVDDINPSTPLQETENRAVILAAPLAPSGWVRVTSPTDELMQNLRIPADAPSRGMWSAARPWPLLGAHSVVLPNGKVMTYGTTPDGSAQAGRHIAIWDPNRGLEPDSHQITFDPARQDAWCGSANYLGDGRLMLNGGNSSQSIQFYSTGSNSLSRGSDMAQQRWYGTTVTLANGGAIAMGGIDPYTEGQVYDPNNAINQGITALTPEVYENGSWRSLFGASSRQAFGPDYLRASYPKAWLAPDGRVFGISTDQMYYVDTNGGTNRIGAIAFKGELNPPPQLDATLENAPNVSVSASAVMYDIGRVMVAGGNAWHNGFNSAGSRRATSIDLNGYQAVKRELARMNFNRHWLHLTVLPDGKVLATGGERFARNDPAFGVRSAEQYTPSTDSWANLASSSVFRAYHSQASLLTNGTVLVTGGGSPGPLQLTGDVFYPPYLFRSVNGVAELAPRPRIFAISGLRHNHESRLQFDMASTERITQVALLGLSAGTHSFNAGQRRIPVKFSQDSFRITANLPKEEVVPPGYYQLVAVNAAGVPSRGTIIAMGGGVAMPPVAAPAYTPPDTDGGVPPSEPPPASSVFCANERSVCVLPANRRATIWFGADTRWVARKNVAGTLACDLSRFTDPALGVVKSCRYMITGTLPSPVGATLTAGSGGSLRDRSGATWTFGTAFRGTDRNVLRNGGGTEGWGRLMQVAADGSVWVQAFNATWWAYNGSAWIQQYSTPGAGGGGSPVPSPVGATLTPDAGGALLDRALVSWSFGPNVRNGNREVLRNGAANGGWARLMRVAGNGSVWVEATDGTWWTFAGNAWVQQGGAP